MTAPVDPYAAQKTAALEVYTQYEEALYAGYLAMMTEWLAGVEKAMFRGGVTSLALMPNPYSVFSQTPAWNELVAKYTEDVVSTVLTGAYERVLGPDSGVLFSTRPFVHNFAAKLTNNLGGMPDQVFSAVGDIIQAGATNGASIPDMQAQIKKLLEATGNEKWAAKARTIAVTTAHTVYSGGTMDAYAAIVENDPETSWVLRWLATDDHRTRPTHVAADGQVVPWGTAFTVGGAKLLYPGDPAGPPEEVINCRCFALLEPEGEPTPMTNRQTKPTTLAAAAVRMRSGSSGRIRTVSASGADELCSLVACRITGKPGLCKGQHRGGWEPGADKEVRQGGDQAAVAKATADAATIAATADRIRAEMATWTPEQRARATRALATYNRQLGSQRQIIQGNRTLQQQHDADVARNKAQAAKDLKEQQALDKKRSAASKMRGIAGTTLKDYQTSTKI